MSTKDREPGYEEMDESPYAQLGEERQPHQQRNMFEVVLDEWVEAVVPGDYFITTGEAIIKAEILEKKLWNMAGKARKFVQALKKCRGGNTYLETEWREGRLVVKIKNPRNKKKE